MILDRVRLARSVFANCQFSDKSSFVGADLTSAKATGLIAEGVSFERSIMSDIGLQSCALSKCDMQNSVIINGHLEGARLIGCDLSSANLEEADVKGADFSEAYLLDTRFIRARNVHRATFDESNWRQAEFDDRVRNHLEERGRPPIHIVREQRQTRLEVVDGSG